MRIELSQFSEWRKNCIPGREGIEVITNNNIRGYMSLMTARDAFAQAWNRLGEHGRIVYASALEEIESLRERLDESGCTDARHAEAYEQMRQFFSAVPNFEFRVQPEPLSWIEWCEDPEAVAEAHIAAWQRLEAMMLTNRVRYLMRWNSLKRQSKVRQIVEAFHCTAAPLDLWDVVRFRVVLSGLAALRDFCAALMLTFGADVFRVRNYYFSPRKGPLDPYRAVHFELAVNTHGRRVYFELQALTLARDAVGLLDHDVLYKSEAESELDPYRYWLNQLRMAANVFDHDRSLGRLN